MNTRERFGNYVLLKKLAEDSLGEVFRAGRFGSQGIEQVVLLRVLNGQGLDSARLWQQVSQRGDVQSIIKSPNLGNGIDFGELQGVPFVVYDYVSGKDLATLMAQARKERSPVPADHALLITERIALGLTAAFENRRQGSRILHGFVVPNLVMVSNEGEARLLGFEAGPGLRELSRDSAALKPFERYMAPEVLAGQPADKADDVYSLGVILFELLTGKELSNARALSLDALIDDAVLAGEDLPIPPAINTLLKRSLAAREQRIPDCVTWHKSLSQLMIDSHYNPTTFNLAFFMHNLFQEEIERESREIQVEKNFEDSGVEIPATTATGAAGAAGAETMMISASDVAPALGTTEDEEGQSRSWLGILAALVALAVLGGLGYWFLLGPGSSKPDLVAEAPVTQPVVEPEPTPAGPTQEEIQAELERMREEMAEAMAAQSEEMRQALADQYEGKLKELEGQYDQSQKALQERRRKEQEAALAAQQATIEEEARKRAQLQQEEARKQAQPPAKAAQPPAGTAQSPANAKKDPAGSTKTSTQKPPTQRPAAQGADTQKASTQEAKPPAAAPPPPAVRVGDLVQAGPGVIAPKLLAQAPPRYPSAARRLRREATVIVRGLVDERGRVVKAERLGKKVGMGIDEAALSAAQESTFTPASKDGIRVKMWHSLRFDFRP